MISNFLKNRFSDLLDTGVKTGKNIQQKLNQKLNESIDKEDLEGLNAGIERVKSGFTKFLDGVQDKIENLKNTKVVTIETGRKGWWYEKSVGKKFLVQEATTNFELQTKENLYVVVESGEHNGKPVMREDCK